MKEFTVTRGRMKHFLRFSSEFKYRVLDDSWITVSRRWGISRCPCGCRGILVSVAGWHRLQPGSLRLRKPWTWEWR